MGKKFLPSRQNGIEVVLFRELLDEFLHRLFGFEALSLCDNPVTLIELLPSNFFHMGPPLSRFGEICFDFSIVTIL